MLKREQDFGSCLGITQPGDKRNVHDHFLEFVADAMRRSRLQSVHVNIFAYDRVGVILQQIGCDCCVLQVFLREPVMETSRSSFWFCVVALVHVAIKCGRDAAFIRLSIIPHPAVIFKRENGCDKSTVFGLKAHHKSPYVPPIYRTISQNQTRDTFACAAK